MILNNSKKRFPFMDCFEQREERSLLAKVSRSPGATGQRLCGVIIDGFANSGGNHDP